MLKKLKNENLIIITIGILYVFANAIFIYKQIPYFYIIPFTLIVAGFILLSIDKVFYIIVFFTPFSISLKYLGMDLPVNLFLPTEPLLIILMLLFIVKVVIEQKFDKKIIFHPVTLSIFFYLFWIVITSLTSTLPVVSIKALISKLWFIVPMFFLATQIFYDYKKIKPFIWIYTISLVIVVFYATYRHVTIGFSAKNVAHYVVKPFYNDHTAYGAILALFIPIIMGFATNSNYKKKLKIISWIVTGILITAVLLSYSRAAWLSLILALGFFIATKLKIKFKYIAIVVVIIMVIFIKFNFQIFDALEKNKTDSSSKLSDHITSITNVKTDASNMERILRWNCAIRMFKEKPYVGWGAGTYMFQYAPFQFKSERTIISTNFGEGGNAHSEYLGPLAETGLIGMLSVILIMIVTILTAAKVYLRTKDKEVKMLSISLILGLSTYYLHGFLNNFLDTDKLSVPFWGFTAIIVALDIYHKKEMKINERKEIQ